MSDERSFFWGDEAAVFVLPTTHPSFPFTGDLAACVRRAIEIAEGEPPPGHVEISHESGLIQMDEVRRMAMDPSFPPEEEVEINDFELGPMS